MIWIVTGTAGRAAFNALRRNTVMVYPNSVKQYTGGIWKYVSAKVYQNGAWAMMGTLYSNGIFSVEHTEKVVNGAIQYGDTAFTVSTKSGNLVGEAYAVLGPVLLERVSTVTMKAKKTDTMASTNLVLMAAQSDSTNRDGAAVKTEQSVTDAAEHTVSLDVSGCTGDGWYIYAGTNTGGAKLANARTVDVMEVTLA